MSMIRPSRPICWKIFTAQQLTVINKEETLARSSLSDFHELQIRSLEVALSKRPVSFFIYSFFFADLGVGLQLLGAKLINVSTE